MKVFLLRFFIVLIACLRPFPFSVMEGKAASDSVRSPFVKPAPAQVNNKPVVATPLDALEFNGLVVIGGKTHVSLLDTKTKKNYWLSEDEAADDGLQIVRIDQEVGQSKQRVVVRRGAATKELSMREFDIITAVAPKRPVAQATTSAVNTSRPTNGKSSGIQSASDDEVRERMKRVAEEIRRRRAMRRTASEQAQSRKSN